MILDIGSKTAGVVLNAVDFSKHEYKYATYYGRYGYGTPYGETPEESKPVAADVEREEERDGHGPSASA